MWCRKETYPPQNELCIKSSTMGIHIEVPEGLPLSDFELRMNLAAKLFDRGLITSGQGAKMADLSKQAFLELLGKYEVSVFQYDMNEVLDDLQTIRNARNR